MEGNGRGYDRIRGRVLKTGFGTALLLFAAGVVFWGGFNTILEATNTETFCIGCHEMHDNVYQELKETVHYTNNSGVRASCPDCHVPHNWTSKIARKMAATKEIYGTIFGTINTPEKFEAKRLILAQHEWDRMEANDSLECRNCHSEKSMDFTRQSKRASEAHQRFLVSGERTCIDCHKGIAHELPDMGTAQSHMQMHAHFSMETKSDLESYLKAKQ